MPRLSNELYFERYRFLRMAWLEFRSLYAVLRLDQQLNIHTFYQPDSDLDKVSLVEHRERVTNQHPSLPAEAGKLFLSPLQDLQTRL
jgi:hypothetical protein